MRPRWGSCWAVSCGQSSGPSGDGWVHCGVTPSPSFCSQERGEQGRHPGPTCPARPGPGTSQMWGSPWVPLTWRKKGKRLGAHHEVMGSHFQGPPGMPSPGFWTGVGTTVPKEGRASRGPEGQGPEGQAAAGRQGQAFDRRGKAGLRAAHTPVHQAGLGKPRQVRQPLEGTAWRSELFISHPASSRTSGPWELSLVQKQAGGTCGSQRSRAPSASQSAPLSPGQPPLLGPPFQGSQSSGFCWGQPHGHLQEVRPSLPAALCSWRLGPGCRVLGTPAPRPAVSARLQAGRVSLTLQTEGAGAAPRDLA